MKNLLYYINFQDRLHYSVSVDTFSRTNKLLKNKLSYEYDIRLLTTTLKGYIVSFKRNNMLINNTKDQSFINEILLSAGEIQSDLELEVTRYGQILKVKNWKKIQEKWEILKDQMLYTYKGKMVVPFLDSIDEKMKEESLFIKSLNNDLFFFYFLKGIYGDYENNYTKFNGLLYGLYTPALEVEKKNRLMINENKDYSIDYQMKLSSEGFQKLQDQLKERYGDGSLSVDIKGEYHFENDKKLTSMQAFHEFYWDEQLVKYTNINIELKNN